MLGLYLMMTTIFFLDSAPNTPTDRCGNGGFRKSSAGR
uniref:Uncharacterized protein n=1 Tax=Anguilla anguilla TaxID=7936 RepID=A0A0E9QKC4_ANGAN